MWSDIQKRFIGTSPLWLLAVVVVVVGGGGGGGVGVGEVNSHGLYYCGMLINLE